jgi:hypothetical protein
MQSYSAGGAMSSQNVIAQEEKLLSAQERVAFKMI